MKQVVLRDMVQSDIEDYVKWFSTRMEWQKFDAPWEPVSLCEEEERKSWTEYFDKTKDLNPDRTRCKFEIEWQGKHVGWVSCYNELSFVPYDDKTCAVGIDLADDASRGKGVGTAALKMFIDYLHGKGNNLIYIETWSGNLAMMRVAEKLGFQEAHRQYGARQVDGKAYDAITLWLSLFEWQSVNK